MAARVPRFNLLAKHHSSLIFKLGSSADSPGIRARHLTSRVDSSKAMPLEVSDGADADAIRLQVESLQGNGWDLVDNNMLKKTYCFATYTKVMVQHAYHTASRFPPRANATQDFHTVIGVRSKSTNHHPTMTTVNTS